MAYGEIPLEYYTERGWEVPGPSWTSDELAAMDDDDIAAVKLAMERSAADRLYAQYYRFAGCDCYSHDGEGDCRLDDDLMRPCCQESPYYQN